MDDVNLCIYHGSDDFVLEIDGLDEIALTREERDMFVALHMEAMDNGDNVFSFNQDAPKHRMKLSGDDDFETDVEIE